MVELRGKGFSYWKIADILNAMKVPTKTRKGKWHARSVQQILGWHLGVKRQRCEQTLAATANNASLRKEVTLNSVQRNKEQ
jgi:hypothetical protein